MAVAEKLDTKVERGPWKWALYTRSETMQSIPAFLWALKDMGGVCADKSGRAPARVFAHAEKMGTPLHPRSAPSAMLRELENGTYAGAIKRTKGSRQTYRIELLLTDEQMPPKPLPVKTTKIEPERLAVKPRDVESELAKAPKDGDTVNIPKADGGTGPRPADPTPEPKPHPGPTPGPRPEDPNTKPELAVVPPGPAPELVEPTLPPIVAVPASDPLNALLEIQGLAMQAVLGLAQQMGQGVDPQDAADRDAEKARLATTLEENQRLRRKVNDLTETIVAKSKENEAMRRALMTAQSNLAAIQKAAADAPGRERQLANLRATERFMQERPAVR
jgi:hypothetical protein